jgi:hypothetical protein
MRTHLQRARRAALADASVGEGHDEDHLELLLSAPVQPTVTCPGCQRGYERGRAHICPTPAPETPQ